MKKTILALAVVLTVGLTSAFAANDGDFVQVPSVQNRQSGRFMSRIRRGHPERRRCSGPISSNATKRLSHLC